MEWIIGWMTQPLNWAGDEIAVRIQGLRITDVNVYLAETKRFMIPSYDENWLNIENGSKNTIPIITFDK